MAQLAVGATMGRRTAALAASNEGHLVQAGSAPTPTPLLLMGVVPNINILYPIICFLLKRVVPPHSYWPAWDGSCIYIYICIYTYIYIYETLRDILKPSESF